MTLGNALEIAIDELLDRYAAAVARHARMRGRPRGSHTPAAIEAARLKARRLGEARAALELHLARLDAQNRTRS